MNIEINGLKKFHHKDFGIDIDNFSFQSNIITGIEGDNGAGKTTLLKIIAGLISYDSGNILYNKDTINNIRKEITLVYQKPYMLDRTVYENLEYPLKVRKVPKDIRKEKINYMAEKLSIKNLLDKNATKLSGGEMQKVQIGRGLIFKPKLLLLDEPTSGVAKENILTVENLILDYKNLGGTVIIVTHQKEQRKLCDKLVTMKGGKII